MFGKLIAAGLLWVLNFLQSPAGLELVSEASRQLENLIEEANPDLDDGDNSHPARAEVVQPATRTTVSPEQPSAWKE